MHTSLITAALRPTIQQQQQQHHLHPSSSSTGGPCIPSSAPRYLSDFLRRVADLPSRRRLWSATSNQLDVRPSRLVTVGDRSFASVGPKLWNSLPDDITSASSLPVFLQRNWKLTYFSNLIRTLFCSLLWFSIAIVVLEVICYLGHVKKCWPRGGGSDPIRPTRWGPGPNRPTRRAFFENWPTGTLSAGRQGRQHRCSV